jgi:hypothetical protein
MRMHVAMNVTHGGMYVRIAYNVHATFYVGFARMYTYAHTYASR